MRQLDVELDKGNTVVGVCKLLAVIEQTYFRWRKEYGGLKVDQAEQFKQLEAENARRKRLLADAELDKAILRKAARTKPLSPARRRVAVEHIQTEMGVSERRACPRKGGCWARPERCSGTRRGCVTTRTG